MAAPIINIKFFADLKQFSTQMDNAARSLEKRGKQFQKAGRNLSLNVTAPLLALGGLVASTAAKFEKLETSLVTTFQGNEAAAAAAQRRIEEFTSKTPFQLEEVTSAFIKLKNLGLDPSERALTSYGNTAAAMGKSLDQAVEAVADAATGEFERLKEFGIRAKQQGDQVTFTFRGVETTVRKDAASIQEYLLRIGETDFAGGIERQSRTFTGRLSTLRDNLELTGKEFGDIILEALEPFIEKLQDAAKFLRALDPETKKFIVVAGGIAAAIGPAIVAVGTLLRNLSAIIPVLKTLTVAIAANPIGALAVAIGAVAGTLLIANSRFTALTDAQAEFASLTAKATTNIAREKAELDRLLVVARDETRAKDDRQRAISRLNAISPEYLGNLNLENINTDKAAQATERYVDALLLKAKVIAAEEKLVEVQRQLLDLQLNTNDAVKPSLWQNLANAIKSGGDQYRFIANSVKTATENAKAEETALTELQSRLTSFLNDNQSLISSNTKVAQSFVNVAGAVGGLGTGSGLDLDFENDIISLEEVQATLIASGGILDNAIDDAKVEAFRNKIENIGTAFSDLNEKVDPELESFRQKTERLQALGEAVGGAVGDAFANLGNRIADGLGAAEGGFKAFVATLVQTATKLIAIMLSQSLANSIAGATASGTATGPAAIFTTPAFIAQAIGGVLAAFAAIPKFATGGVVGGSSFTGDKILARLNSGELVLNAQQQNRLLGMLDGGGRVVEVPYVASTLIEGSNIRVVLDRADRQIARNG